jgi:hypothetical protein
MSVPPSEFRRRALQQVAERQGQAPSAPPVDLQLGPMPRAQQGGAMSSVDLEGLLGGPPGAGAPTGSVTSRDTGEDLDQIRTAIQALQLYAEGTHDDQELAKVHKCIVALQSILADHSKNREAALGMTPAMRHIRRTSARY